MRRKQKGHRSAVIWSKLRSVYILFRGSFIWWYDEFWDEITGYSAIQKRAYVVVVVVVDVDVDVDVEDRRAQAYAFMPASVVVVEL